MSTEQNKAILRRWMEGWSTRSLSVMDTALSCGMAPRASSGAKGFNTTRRQIN